MKSKKVYTGDYKVKKGKRYLTVAFRSPAKKGAAAGTPIGTKRDADALAALLGGKAVRA